jgi:hypothetical protein
MSKQNIIDPERDAIDQYNLNPYGPLSENSGKISLAFDSNPTPSFSFFLMSPDPFRHLGINFRTGRHKKSP